MKNFYKRHFYSIPEVFEKVKYSYEDKFIFTDSLRALLLWIVLFLTMFALIGLSHDFISWDFKHSSWLLRWSFILFILYIFILKKWK